MYKKFNQLLSKMNLVTWLVTMCGQRKLWELGRQWLHVDPVIAGVQDQSMW